MPLVLLDNYNITCELTHQPSTLGQPSIDASLKGLNIVQPAGYNYQATSTNLGGNICSMGVIHGVCSTFLLTSHLEFQHIPPTTVVILSNNTSTDTLGAGRKGRLAPCGDMRMHRLDLGTCEMRSVGQDQYCDY